MFRHNNQWITLMMPWVFIGIVVWMFMSPKPTHNSSVGTEVSSSINARVIGVPEWIDGKSFERVGAMIYMINYGGDRISDGFHSFTRLDDHIWIGTVGSRSYLLKDGKTISDGYHKITRTANGYDASLGATDYKLDQDGHVLP